MPKLEEFLLLMMRKHEQTGLTELSLDVPPGMDPEDLAEMLLQLDAAMATATPMKLGDSTFTEADRAEMARSVRAPRFLEPFRPTPEQAEQMAEALRRVRDPSVRRLRLLPGLGIDAMRREVMGVCGAGPDRVLH